MDVTKKHFQNIDEALEQMKEIPGAVLLDVRADSEYRQGHIPGSIHMPLPKLAEMEERFPERDTPLFVYCLSGGRAGRAVSFLEKLGYTAAVNIGGIKSYSGEVEK